MEIWSEVTGVKSEVVEMTIEEKAKEGPVQREGAESNMTSAEFGWGKNLVTPKDVSGLLAERT
jgi:hypothetical protein